MKMAKNLKNGELELTLKGSFTFNDHANFREVLDQIARPEIRQVTLHMAAVDFVDSAALGMLLLAHDEAEKHKKQIVLSGAAGQARKMFDMAHFDTMFIMN